VAVVEKIIIPQHLIKPLEIIVGNGLLLLFVLIMKVGNGKV
jgi:hypothetical protein